MNDCQLPTDNAAVAPASVGELAPLISQPSATLGHSVSSNRNLQLDLSTGAVVVGFQQRSWWEFVLHKFGAHLVASIVVGHAPGMTSSSDASPLVSRVSTAYAAWRRVNTSQASILLIDGLLPALTDSIWLDPKLQLIIATGSNRRTWSKYATSLSSHGWTCGRQLVHHAEQGGVTDGQHYFYTCCRSPQLPTVQARGLRQDLRCILKAGQPGRRALCPTSDGNKIGTSVNWCRSGVASCRGLLPSRGRLPQIRTLFGKNWWVDRRLQPMELLLAWDVPEMYVRSLSVGECEQLSQCRLIPLRCREAIATGWLSVESSRSVGSDGGMQEARGIKRYGAPLTATRDGRAKVESSDPRGEKRHAMDGRAKVESSNPRGEKRHANDTSRSAKMSEQPCKLHRSGTGAATLTASGEAQVQATASVTQPSSMAGIEEQEYSQFRDDGVSAQADVSKAVKSDHARTPTEFWNRELLDPFKDFIMQRDWRQAVRTLREFSWSWLRRRTTRSFGIWKQSIESKGLIVSQESMDAGRDAIRRFANSTIWKWPQGSRCFFWMWPPEFQERIRDGIKLWLTEHLKPFRKAQSIAKDKDVVEKIKKKLADVRAKGYVEPGWVESLTAFFAVPKGLDDLRMVYDGTVSGLNEVLWAPWFPLPTVESMLRAVEPGTFMADNDVGEMFLNFMLHEEVRKLAGVDFTLYFPGEVTSDAGRLWERWSRCAMGLRTSPYQAIQAMTWAKEIILGDRFDQENVFRWDRVVFNLPGMPEYDPSKTWACKVRKDGTLACDVFIYVDDCRYTGPTKQETWKASQRGSSILGRLGIQDASRKRRYPSQEAGAWAGSVVHSSHGTVAKLLTQERWDKARRGIQWIKDALDSSPDRMIPRKPLASWRGFLIYIGRTYRQLVPYFRGIHATLDGWRADRDDDGWKIPGYFDHLNFDDEDCGDVKPGASGEQPDFVKAVPRLDLDLEALLELTASETPPLYIVRADGVVLVTYGFGDASGIGFGTAIELDGNLTRVRRGTWPWTIGQEMSSNWRELSNLVDAVEELANEGQLEGKEVFLFTDNSVAERAYFKGTSKSKTLFALVLKLRRMELTGKFKLHLIHVAGTRMIETGIDGLSRGDESTGVMAGIAMLDFVPLHLTAVAREPLMTEWIRSWAPDDMDLKVLTPEEWFAPFQEGSLHVWMPPPAAADMAVELLAEGIHKRPNCFHVVVVPRLMTYMWRKTLGKTCDVMLEIPAKDVVDELFGEVVWGARKHEPLILALVFPLSSRKPWRAKFCDVIARGECDLRSVSKENPILLGSCLRELLVQARALPGV